MSADPTAVTLEDMLNPVLSSLAQAVDAMVIRHLSQDPKPANLLGLHQEFSALSEAVLPKLLDTQRTLDPANREPACRKGCDWCCHFIVTAPAPTVLVLARTIEDQRHEMIERLAAGYEGAIDFPGPPGQMLRCPLLGKEGCTAYADRPLTCRAKNAFDDLVCKARYHDMSVDVAGYHSTTLAEHGMVRSLGMAIEKLGYHGSDAFVDLRTGLHTALSTENAEERWLAGEPIFEACRLDVNNRIIGAKLAPLLAQPKVAGTA